MMGGMSDATAIPSTIVAGTTVEYTRAYDDYPASAGWSLSLHLAGASVLTRIATPDGDSFDVTISAASTAGLAPGRYVWEERVSGVAGRIIRVAGGTLQVTPDVAAATPGALQSPDERLLVLLDAMVERRATSPNDWESSQIGPRAVTLTSLEAIVRLRNQTAWRVQILRNGGRLPPRKITFGAI